jgi:hypothetical protein
LQQRPFGCTDAVRWVMLLGLASGTFFRGAVNLECCVDFSRDIGAAQQIEWTFVHEYLTGTIEAHALHVLGHVLAVPCPHSVPNAVCMQMFLHSNLFVPPCCAVCPAVPCPAVLCYALACRRSPWCCRCRCS